MPTVYIVILFYKFTHIAEPKVFADSHRDFCKEREIFGRMIVAEEGVNATFEGTRENIEQYKTFLTSDLRFQNITIKESAGNGSAFTRLSIRARDEVVTLGAGKFDVAKETAKELPASELQKWYETGEDFVVLDLRNDYEIASGKFDKTIDPGLTNFRDLPEKVAKIKEISDLKGKKIVAVCTGGIRCEKATCLLQKEGIANLYQLKDGIHTYMKEYPGGHFKGTLFVFDNRMTTDIVPTKNKTIIGRCSFCLASTENYCSDDSVRPSRKILCCHSCFAKNASRLRESVTTA
ncbi:MAG TPA: rhodanese-like domain-containing protein [Candidatus Paceibacterota bacterium]|nr:rhodanese-like domain-containing protein [Candidatus Paceibacterota bacterium]